jgi:hypothetical protein
MSGESCNGFGGFEFGLVGGSGGRWLCSSNGFFKISTKNHLFHFYPFSLRLKQ